MRIPVMVFLAAGVAITGCSGNPLGPSAVPQPRVAPAPRPIVEPTLPRALDDDNIVWGNLRNDDDNIVWGNLAR